MKKILAISVLVVFLMSCHRTKEEKAMLNFLDRSYKVLLDETTESLLYFDMSALENPVKAGLWKDRAYALSAEIDSVIFWIDSSDGINKAAIEKLRAYKSQIIQNLNLHDREKSRLDSTFSFDYNLKNPHLWKGFAKNDLVLLKNEALKIISQNVSSCGLVFYILGTELRIQDNHAELLVESKNSSEKAAERFIITELLKDGKPYHHPHTDSINYILGSLKFENLPKGNYQLKGEYQVLLDKRILQKKYFDSGFEVK